MMIRKAMLGVALIATVGVPAVAQDQNARPTARTLNLNGGFLPDPNVTNVAAGGRISAARLGNQCRGFVDARPHVRLNFNPGELPLIISASSRTDTVLVVNAPDGRWYCNDDDGEGPLNPSVRFDDPMEGRYEIWVGTYQRVAPARARLHISEIETQ